MKQLWNEYFVYVVPLCHIQKTYLIWQELAPNVCPVRAEARNVEFPSISLGSG